MKLTEEEKKLVLDHRAKVKAAEDLKEKQRTCKHEWEWACFGQVPGALAQCLAQPQAAGSRQTKENDMKTKVSEASGPVLDWMVAKCEGVSLDGEVLFLFDGEPEGYNYSNDWSQGGPIIEREGIDVGRDMGAYPELEDGTLGTELVYQWMASTDRKWQYGPTPLIAAMRCYVASKLGKFVEVPDGIA